MEDKPFEDLIRSNIDLPNSQLSAPEDDDVFSILHSTQRSGTKILLWSLPWLVAAALVFLFWNPFQKTDTTTGSNTDTANCLKAPDIQPPLRLRKIVNTGTSTYAVLQDFDSLQSGVYMNGDRVGAYTIHEITTTRVILNSDSSKKVTISTETSASAWENYLQATQATVQTQLETGQLSMADILRLTWLAGQGEDGFPELLDHLLQSEIPILQQRRQSAFEGPANRQSRAERLIKLSNEGDPKLAPAAIAALAKNESPLAWPYLRKQLQAPGHPLFAAYLQAAISHGGAEGILAIQDALQVPNLPQTRRDDIERALHTILEGHGHETND